MATDSTNPLDTIGMTPMTGTEPAPLISQDDVDDVEVSFVEDAPTEETVASEPERRGQNEATDPDPLATERQRFTEREREYLAREEHAYRVAIEAEKKRVATERDSATMALDAVDLRLDQARKALKAARRDGDTDAETDFEKAVRDLEQVRGNIVHMQSQLPTSEAIDREFSNWRAQHAPRSTSNDIRPVGDNPLANKFIEQNGWMRDGSNPEAQNYAITASANLAKEGVSPNSPEHFAELSRRIAHRFPSLAVRMTDGRGVGQAATRTPAQARPSSSPPVASARPSAAAPNGVPRQRTRVELTGSDRQMMRMMGMDPSDKTAAKRFAREKYARLNMESRS